MPDLMETSFMDQHSPSPTSIGSARRHLRPSQSVLSFGILVVVSFGAVGCAQSGSGAASDQRPSSSAAAGGSAADPIRASTFYDPEKGCAFSPEEFNDIFSALDFGITNLSTSGKPSIGLLSCEYSGPRSSAVTLATTEYSYEGLRASTSEDPKEYMKSLLEGAQGGEATTLEGYDSLILRNGGFAIFADDYVFAFVPTVTGRVDEEALVSAGLEAAHEAAARIRGLG